MAVRIDTKYARHDVKRMENAIKNMQEGLTILNELKGNILESYKGNAGEALVGEIQFKINSIDRYISELRAARKALINTIDQYEALNKDVVNKIQG